MSPHRNLAVSPSPTLAAAKSKHRNKELREMLNLTQHAATPDQINAGVTEPTPDVKKSIQALLTFNTLPSKAAIDDAAQRLARIAAASGAKSAMIGGAPWISRALEDALLARGIRPAYAFSARVSEEHHLPDGTVKKVQVFKHEGFVFA